MGGKTGVDSRVMTLRLHARLGFAAAFLGLGACTSVLGKFDEGGGGAIGSGGAGGGATAGCKQASDCVLGELDAQCAKADCVSGQCSVSLLPKGSECDAGKGRCDGAGDCRECLDDTDCAQGTCLDGLCTGKPLGEVCGESAHCTSSFCVFGLCCDRECVGACEACNLPGKEGTCQVAPLGSVGEPACAPFLCNGTSGTCPKECSADAQCASGRYCEPATKGCELKKDDASPCASDASCKSGECYQGLDASAHCCATACACGSCTTGKCVVSAVPGSDPASECAGGVCDGLVGCSTNGAVSFVFGLAGEPGTTISPTDVVVDANGSAVVVGTFSGTVAPLDKTLTSLGFDAFVLKVSPKGTLEWFTRIGEKFGTTSHSATSVAIDKDGSILVAGNYSGSVALGGTTFETVGSSAFIARLAPTGKVLEGTGIVISEPTASLSASALELDGEGSAFLAGTFSGKVPLTKLVTSAGGLDGYVLRLDTVSFKPIADVTLGGLGQDAVNAIAFRAPSTLAIGGSIGGDATLNSKLFKNAGSSDAFVVVASVGAASITQVNAAVYGSTGADDVRSLRIGPNGSIYLGGSVTGGVSFSGGISSPPVLGDNLDPFVVALTGKLVHLWTQRYPTPGLSLTVDLAVDTAGFVLSGGRYSGTMTPKTGMTLTSQNGGSDAFVLKHHPGTNNSAFGGMAVWAVTPDLAPAFDIAQTLTTTPERDIVVAGSYGGEYALAGKSLPAVPEKDSALVVARLRQ